MKKRKIIYYNEHDKIDRLATFVNNHVIISSLIAFFLMLFGCCNF